MRSSVALTSHWPPLRKDSPRRGAAFTNESPMPALEAFIRRNYGRSDASMSLFQSIITVNLMFGRISPLP